MKHIRWIAVVGLIAIVELQYVWLVNTYKLTREGLVNELHSTIFGEIKKEQNLILTIEQEEEVLKKEIDRFCRYNKQCKQSCFG